MGRKSRRERICVHLRLIYFTLWQRLAQHCKATVPPALTKKTVTRGCWLIAMRRGIRQKIQQHELQKNRTLPRWRSANGVEARTGCKQRPPLRGLFGIWKANRLQVKGLCKMIGSIPFWIFNSGIFSSMEYILIFPPGNNSFFPWHL